MIVRSPIIPINRHHKHCIALHCIALHCIALHCIALHCIALHCTALHCTALHCTALHCTALHCTALHCTALHCIATLQAYNAKCCQMSHFCKRLKEGILCCLQSAVNFQLLFVVWCFNSSTQKVMTLIISYD